MLYSKSTIFAISISGLQKPYYTRSWKIKRQRKYSNFPTVDQAGVARLAVPRTAFGSCGAETGMAAWRWSLPFLYFQLFCFSFFLLLVLEYNENDLLEDRGQPCQNWPITNAFKKNACFDLESKLTD